MATKTANILVGAGVFALALAGLTVVAAQPALFKAPTVKVAHTRASGPATFLDATTGKQVSGTFVETKAIGTHVVNGKKLGTGSVASYDQLRTDTFTDAASGTTQIIGQDKATQAFNRSTGAGRPGQLSDTLATKAHLFKLPFNTKKQAYSMWDDQGNVATDLQYVGAKTVSGVKTYEFKQVVPPTDLGELPVLKAVPGALVGHPEIASIPANEWYENADVRYFIEPVTGSIVGGSSNPHLWAQTTGAPAGLKVDLLKVDNAVPEKATQAQLAKDAKDAKASVQLLKRAPWVLALLGLFLLGLGIWRRTRSGPVPASSRPDVSGLVPSTRREPAVDPQKVQP